VPIIALLGLPPWLDLSLRTVIVSPFMQKVHHSRWQPETDSNYSSLFPFWDRLFGSFRLREDPRTLEFELEEFDPPEHQTLVGLLTTPMERARRTDQPSRRSPSGH
jgi:sterol desaturase/sphingolipid hydroxylase (fatty acid hydroxylase superfamily)